MAKNVRRWRPPLPYLRADLGHLQLLREVEPYMDSIHVENLRGKEVAVDAYSLLYKAADLTGCCRELAVGIETDEHIKYCINMVNLLRNHGATPTFVFHGRTLDLFKGLEFYRKSDRLQNLKLALMYYGDVEYSKKYFRRSFTISHIGAYRLIQELRDHDVKFIVAPYDANAQLAFLLKKNLVEAVITEDPSLILFGCPKIIFKMNKDGYGYEFQTAKLLDFKPGDPTLSFAGFTIEKLRHACLLTGCSYVPYDTFTIPDVCGIYKILGHFYEVIEHVSGPRYDLPTNTLRCFEKAEWAYQYQKVYDPEKMEMVGLSELPEHSPKYFDWTKHEFLFPSLSRKDVTAIADGTLDPLTMEPFEDKKNDGIKRPIRDTREIFKDKKAEFFSSEEGETCYYVSLLESGCLSSSDESDEEALEVVCEKSGTMEGERETQ